MRRESLEGPVAFWHDRQRGRAEIRGARGSEHRLLIEGRARLPDYRQDVASDPIVGAEIGDLDERLAVELEKLRARQRKASGVRSSASPRARLVQLGAARRRIIGDAGKGVARVKRKVSATVERQLAGSRSAPSVGTLLPRLDAFGIMCSMISTVADADHLA